MSLTNFEKKNSSLVIQQVSSNFFEKFKEIPTIYGTGTAGKWQTNLTQIKHYFKFFLASSYTIWFLIVKVLFVIIHYCKKISFLALAQEKCKHMFEFVQQD